MKPLLIIASLALTGIAGVAVAQTVDPYTPPPNERYEPGPSTSPTTATSTNPLIWTKSTCAS